MARFGMLPLIARWRRMVDDVAETIWDEDAAEEILDQHREDFFGIPLVAIPRHVNGSTFHTVYSSEYRNLEVYTANDDTVFRLFDSTGASPLVADYAFDYINGLVTFAADQAGKTFYLSGRSYDLNAAAAQGWEESSGYAARYADVKIGENQKSRSQIFDHCMKMAQHYRSKGGMRQARVLRA